MEKDAVPTIQVTGLTAGQKRKGIDMQQQMVSPKKAHTNTTRFDGAEKRSFLRTAIADPSSMWAAMLFFVGFNYFIHISLQQIRPIHIITFLYNLFTFRVQPIMPKKKHTCTRRIAKRVPQLAKRPPILRLGLINMGIQTETRRFKKRVRSKKSQCWYVLASIIMT